MAAFFHEFVAAVEHIGFVGVEDDCLFCYAEVTFLRPARKWISCFLDGPFD